jgi:hypothetical protein
MTWRKTHSSFNEGMTWRKTHFPPWHTFIK